MATRDDPPFKVRMPGDLRERVNRAAKASGRSINAEIVARLEASFAVEEVHGVSDTHGMADVLKALASSFDQAAKSGAKEFSVTISLNDGTE
jgi:hypothetical protein